MNLDEIKQIQDIEALVDVTARHDDDADWVMLDGVLCGSTALAVSNHGGELKDILDRLSEACQNVKRCAAFLLKQQ